MPIASSPYAVTLMPANHVRRMMVRHQTMANAVRRSAAKTSTAAIRSGTRPAWTWRAGSRSVAAHSRVATLALETVAEHTTTGPVTILTAVHLSVPPTVTAAKRSGIASALPSRAARARGKAMPAPWRHAAMHRFLTAALHTARPIAPRKPAAGRFASPNRSAAPLLGITSALK